MLSFQNSDIYKEEALVAGIDDFIPKESLAFVFTQAIYPVSRKSERFDPLNKTKFLKMADYQLSKGPLQM